MALRALVSFHRVPVSLNGSNAVVRQRLSTLTAIGLRCTLATYARPSESDSVRRQARDYAAESGIEVDVTTLPADEADREAELAGRDGRVRWEAYDLPSVERRFEQLARKLHPQLVLVYSPFRAYLGRIGTSMGATTVVESHDLVSRRLALLHRIAQDVERDALFLGGADHTFDPRSYADLDVEDSEEMARYDAFDHTLAISRPDFADISRRAPRTSAHYLPVLAHVDRAERDWSGPPVMVASSNLLNLHAIAYLVRFVLPELRSHSSSCEIRLAGGACRDVPDAPGLVKLGFQEDLRAVYHSAGFALCPMFWGSGQNVKIVEAMAHGLAPVVFDTIAARCHVVHGVNGLVAHDRAEFVQHAAELSSDRRLRERLGREAWKTVERHHSIAAGASLLREICEVY